MYLFCPHFGFTAIVIDCLSYGTNNNWLIVYLCTKGHASSSPWAGDCSTCTALVCLTGPQNAAQTVFQTAVKNFVGLWWIFSLLEFWIIFLGDVMEATRRGETVWIFTLEINKQSIASPHPPVIFFFFYSHAGTRQTEDSTKSEARPAFYWKNIALLTHKYSCICCLYSCCLLVIWIAVKHVKSKIRRDFTVIVTCTTK